mmetsp:Transcript_100507/g.199629  ORF Transcript_100507/g.199629 Transcript_100507/m.199629 type:complete len:214 (+) Transcript_100507:78-719(+)|eukprot:CAMPEP_0172662230 /NCGR_PEP_ID=MMETSP1074-20121228/5232_1 /TAXON_ID=2916 /ORGANISM="Ceratium fusus, Strain PA161109" /LENGTH=213 /DNA_ID=CAMNT_0013478119 /DNA_START=15 /DNA_END=656 /DNA_ORIENTATION=-
MALKLQLIGVCLVLQLMGCQGSECATASSDYSNIAVSKQCETADPCPDACKTPITNYYSKCAGTTETWIYPGDGTTYKVGEYPFTLIGVGSVYYSAKCKEFAHDESMKHIKNCDHAFSLFILSDVFPYCKNSQTSCDKRCQETIDAIQGNCKTGDKYTNIDHTIVTVDESQLAAELSLLGPATCTYGTKKSILSSTLSKPWQSAVFFAIAILL